jgi:hypothetical protein
MPHDLATIHDQPAMMYYGEEPWHGLGTALAKPATAAQAMIHERFEEIGNHFRHLAQVPVTHERLAHYVDRVFPLPADKDDEPAQARVQRARSESARLFDQGRGNTEPKVHSTLWAAYNGVVEFVDYAMTHRDQDRRLDAIWFGSGYLSKARAYKLALDCAAAWKN